MEGERRLRWRNLNFAMTNDDILQGCFVEGRQVFGFSLTIRQKIKGFEKISRKAKKIVKLLGKLRTLTKKKGT